ncbi:SSU ribosomal protein S18p [Euzebya pacifica]|jgi:small subunit ribosomal protein S18|uniref:Small ribosomal subunit protein bS18 n=1 Tax=Euzebya pacifica TaxID=1608957 RepID=A0A346Y536_9ACTN|nr:MULTISPECIES: 30S ribosomal protein S18 [Euzebya]AXV09583.1 SSU ribosomal protein S18p [Euzebya pacifica]
MARTQPQRQQRPAKKKEDFFKANKITYIDYKDVEMLQRFVSERGKLRSARVTGVNPQQQRLLAKAIKNAREMALMPYTNR